MSTTPNLGLEKQLGSEYYNVEVQNRNMDRIDTAVKGVQDKFTPDGKALDADKLDGKEATDFSPASHATDSNIHLTSSEKTKVLGGSNAWVATGMTPNQYPGVMFSPIVPNFVFAEGCSVTFKADANLIGDRNSLIVVGGIEYALRTENGDRLSDKAWVKDAIVSVTLSKVKFPLDGSNESARAGTAFYVGDTARALFSVQLKADAVNNPTGNKTFSGTLPNSEAAACGLPYLWWNITYIAHSGNDGFAIEVATPLGNAGVPPRYRVAAGTSWSVWMNFANIYNALAGTTDFSGYANGTYIFVRR